MSEYRINKAMLDYEEFAVPMEEYLDHFFEVFVKYGFYRGQIRWFEVGLWAIDADGSRYEVASVDCCDSQIHIHRLKKSAPKDRQSNRETRVELAAGDESIVDANADLMTDWMYEQWQALARSWNDVS